MPSGDNGRSLTGAAPQARHGVPLQQHNLQGVALRRTRRVDGVRVDGPSLLGAVRALQFNAPLRGGGGEVETRAAALRRPGTGQRCLDVPVRAARTGDGAARDAAPASWRRWSPLRVSRGPASLAVPPGGLRRRTAVKQASQCVGQGPARPSTRRWTWM